MLSILHNTSEVANKIGLICRVLQGAWVAFDLYGVNNLNCTKKKQSNLFYSDCNGWCHCGVWFIVTGTTQFNADVTEAISHCKTVFCV